MSFFTIARPFPRYPLVIVWILLLSFGHLVATQEHALHNETLLERAYGEAESRKPRCPSLEECRAALKPGRPPKDSVMFYTNRPTNKNVLDLWGTRIADYMNDNHLTGLISGLDWYDVNFVMTRYEGSELEKSQFFINVNRAYAEVTKGRVYLLMPYGTAPRGNSYFWHVEWPIIRDGGKVTEIVWMDLDQLLKGETPPPKELDTLWWKKGDRKPATYPGQALEEQRSFPSGLLSSTSRATSSRAPSQALSFVPSTASSQALTQGPFADSTVTSLSAAPVVTTSSATSITTRRKGGLQGGFFNRGKKAASTA